MRLSHAFKLTVLATALAALALAPAAHAVTSNGKNVRVSIACVGAGGADGVYQSPYNGPYGPGAACKGKLTLKAGKKPIGAGVFTLARGQRKAVTVRFSRKGRALLAASGKLRVKVVIPQTAKVRAPRVLKIKLKVKKK